MVYPFRQSRRKTGEGQTFDRRRVESGFQVQLEVREKPLKMLRYPGAFPESLDPHMSRLPRGQERQP
jgi:hypothetical protein